MEQVQFAVAQVLDSCTQVLRQHMSLRGRIGCWLCGRYRLYWRWRTVSAVSVEKRSGVACSPRSRPMRGSCLHRCQPATSGRNAPARGARAIGGCGRGWPSRQGAGADLDPCRKMPFRPQRRRLRCPLSRPHRLWDTGQTTLWLLTGWSLVRIRAGEPNKTSGNGDKAQRDYIRDYSRSRSRRCRRR